MLEADLQDAGVDVGDLALMESRSWRWFAAKVAGLLTKPVGHDLAGYPLFSTRLQAHFFSPPPGSNAVGEG